MNDFLRIITHARRFKSAIKELGIEQLEEIKIKLQKIIDDRIAEEEAAKIENAERIEKIRNYREALAADGIALDELQEGLPWKNKTSGRVSLNMRSGMKRENILPGPDKDGCLTFLRLV